MKNITLEIKNDFIKEKNINKKQKIFIGSKNKWKIEDYKNFLWDYYEVLSPYDLNIDWEVEENKYSLIENFQNKAIFWAKNSNIVTISEDTWFFIKELNWKPWISVKTWWWKFDKELNKNEFLNFLKEKILNLNDTSCYFLTVLSLSFPNGETYSILHKEEWYIDKNKFWNIENIWYPLSSIFIANWRTKTWSEMNDNEKKNWEKKYIAKIFKLLKKIYE